MKAIPVIFRKSPETQTNYDFVDISEGTGYTIYYMARCADSYRLTRNAIYSYFVSTWISTTQTDFTKVLDLDFDFTFNAPMNIRGTAVINVPMGIYNTAANPITSGYYVARLRKWDGTTETEIADNQGYTAVTTLGTGTTHKHFVDAIDLNVPLTHYKKGETLRVTIELWLKTGSGTGAAYVGHDPKNRGTTETDWESGNFGTSPSVAMALIPFKIDL